MKLSKDGLLRIRRAASVCGSSLPSCSFPDQEIREQPGVTESSLRSRASERWISRLQVHVKRPKVYAGEEEVFPVSRSCLRGWIVRADENDR